VKTIRVDGNDVFAMYNATKLARDYAVENYKPVLIEAMTYRVGHHSTSDDSSAYRSKEEAETRNRRDNPIVRLRKYMEKNGWINEEEDVQWKKDARVAVLQAFNKAETRKKPPVSELFTDVYDKLPKHLQDQQKKLHELIAKYPEQYPLDAHAK
jgi:2-oxoisovalerate dehydrogenase E1 component alpha subunit